MVFCLLFSQPDNFPQNYERQNPMSTSFLNIFLPSFRPLPMLIIVS